MSWLIGVDVGGTFTDFFALMTESDRGSPAQGAVDAGQSGRGDRSPACASLRRVTASMLAEITRHRARHDGRHQRADPAPGRQGRAHRHRGLPRPARDRAADPPARVRPAGGLSAAAGAARAALRGARADHARTAACIAPLDARHAARALVEAVGDAKPDACAVCLLFSFLNPRTSAMLGEALATALPGHLPLALVARCSRSSANTSGSPPRC